MHVQFRSGSRKVSALNRFKQSFSVPRFLRSQLWKRLTWYFELFYAVSVFNMSEDIQINLYADIFSDIKAMSLNLWKINYSLGIMFVNRACSIDKYNSLAINVSIIYKLVN